MFRNTIDLKIKGRNIDRIIKRINKHNIDILDIKYIKYNEVIITIDKINLDKIDNLKTIYEINIIDIHGLDKIKRIIQKNIYLIISFVIGLFILIILSNTIFSVDVIHNNTKLRNNLYKELKYYGIDKYHFKKSYKEIEEIKSKIINKYKDEIEWLEIKSEGVRYIVRVEERIIKKEEVKTNNRDIIALKDARIIKIEAKEGEILKHINDFVHKGDTIITGDIKLNDESKAKISAEGSVYGEVWYKVNIEYPLKEDSKILTGKIKKVLTIRLFNKYIELFNFKKYKTKIRKDKILIKHQIFPIYLSYTTIYETKEIHRKLDHKEALDSALKLVRDKINSKLNEKEYIIDVKKLKVHENNSKIVLELFVSVCEDITDYRNIIDEIELR